MDTTPSIQTPPFEDDTSVLEILNVLLKRWRMVVGVPVIAALLVVGLSFFVSPTYTGSTSFAPEIRSEGGVPAGLGALAGQLGISFGTEASQSPQFYAELVKSRGILERLLNTRYADPTTDEPGDSATLLAILSRSRRNRADSLEWGAKKLAGFLSVGVDAQTNIVTVKAELQYPELAASVPNRLVAYLNDFNTKTRQSQARERRVTQRREQRLAVFCQADK